jgi:hypothetical protein
MATVTWIKSTTGTWLPLETVDLSYIATNGVYVIWHGGQNPWTVRVGQGDIKDRLTAHRGDRVILAHKSKGGLYVTWAALSAPYLAGVERYLANQLSPLVGDRHPDIAAIPVNLPWAA